MSSTSRFCIITQPLLPPRCGLLLQVSIHHSDDTIITNTETQRSWLVSTQLSDTIL